MQEPVYIPHDATRLSSPPEEGERLGARAIRIPPGGRLQDYLDEGELIHPDTVPDWKLEPGELLRPDELTASATAAMITQRGGGLGTSLPTAAMLRDEEKRRRRNEKRSKISLPAADEDSADEAGDAYRESSALQIAERQARAKHGAPDVIWTLDG